MSLTAAGTQSLDGPFGIGTSVEVAQYQASGVRAGSPSIDIVGSSAPTVTSGAPRAPGVVNAA